MTLCKNIFDGQILFQQVVYLLQIWTTANGISFSPPKCATIHFFCIRNILKNLQISLYNPRIPTIYFLKILGLIFDKLFWEFHILNLTASCNQRLNSLRKFSHTTYGADRISSIQINKALISSKKIEYSLSRW